MPCLCLIPLDNLFAVSLAGTRSQQRSGRRAAGPGPCAGRRGSPCTRTGHRGS